MKKKRLVGFILILILSIMLAACETESEGNATQPLSTEYCGSLDHYEYRYDRGRDRQWEEDVLYVAEVFLGEVFANGHPILTDMEFLTMHSMDGADVEYKSYYDPALREEFLRDINLLLAQIPELENHEILYSLQKTLAKLSDLHSAIVIPWENRYPLTLTPFYIDGNVEYRATLLPGKQESLILSRLTAINGVGIEELMECVRPYVSYENEHALDVYISDLLVHAGTLDVIGVTEGIAAATFTFETDQGMQDVLLFPQSYQALAFYDLAAWDLQEAGTIRYWDTESYYWWEYIEEEQLLYVRFNRIVEDRNLVYASFVKQLRQHIQDVPETEKVVVDLRGNPGGYFHASLTHYLSSFLNQLEGREHYVLIDSESYSSAIWLASNLRQMSPDLVLAGMPGGQPANFFASAYIYTMPNSKTEFQMSDTMWITNAQDTQEALMPDVVVYQTLEDYINGIDSVMAYILQDQEPKTQE